MRDAARRFATELANRPIIIKMYQTYLQPHPDYCCMIWNQNRIGESNRLAEILHKVTAFAISNSRQDHIDLSILPSAFERSRAPDSSAANRIPYNNVSAQDHQEEQQTPHLQTRPTLLETQTD